MRSVNVLMNEETVRLMMGRTARSRIIKTRTELFVPPEISYETDGVTLMTLGDALAIGLDFILTPDVYRVEFPTQSGLIFVLEKINNTYGCIITVGFIKEGE